MVLVATGSTLPPQQTTTNPSIIQPTLQAESNQSAQPTRRKRGASREMSQKDLALKFFIAETVEGQFRCKLCQQVISVFADRSFGNLVKHLVAPNSHIIRIEGKTVAEHWKLLLERSTLTPDQLFSMIDRVIERKGITDARDVQESPVMLPDGWCINILDRSYVMLL